MEVGGKRNLLEFALIAKSFLIPTGILYDEDASDFSDKRNEEGAFNKSLDALQETDGSARVWRLTKKYEDHLRVAAGGDAAYGVLCQKFPKVGKPTRARLIAMDPGTPVPKPLDEVLRWLCGKLA